MMSMRALLMRQMQREWCLVWRQKNLVGQSCLFYLMLLIFLPLTLPADPHLLHQVAPGFIWVSILFAFFLSAERLFFQDDEDGVIEQWLVSGYPVSVFVWAKMSVHWGVNMIGMLCLSPCLALLFKLNGSVVVAAMASLICGSPALLLLCALACVLSMGLKQKGLLMGLIVLPLAIPVMVFGSSAISHAIQGAPFSGFLALLLAASLLGSAFLPWAIAGVMRISLVS